MLTRHPALSETSPLLLPNNPDNEDTGSFLSWPFFKTLILWLTRVGLFLYILAELSVAVGGAISYLSTGSEAAEELGLEMGFNPPHASDLAFGSASLLTNISLNAYVITSLFDLSPRGLLNNIRAFWRDRAYLSDGMRGLIYGSTATVMAVDIAGSASANLEIAENGGANVIFSRLNFLLSAGLNMIAAFKLLTRLSISTDQAHLAILMRSMASQLANPSHKLSEADINYCIKHLSPSAMFGSVPQQRQAFLTIFHLYQRLYKTQDPTYPLEPWRIGLHYFLRSPVALLALLGMVLNFNDIRSGAIAVGSWLGLELTASGTLTPALMVLAGSFAIDRAILFMRSNLFATDKLAEVVNLLRFRLNHGMYPRFLAELFAHGSASLITGCSSVTFTYALSSAANAQFPSLPAPYRIAIGMVGVLQGTMVNFPGMAGLAQKALDWFQSADCEHEKRFMLMRTLYDASNALLSTQGKNLVTPAEEGVTSVVTQASRVSLLLGWIYDFHREDIVQVHQMRTEQSHTMTHGQQLRNIFSVDADDSSQSSGSESDHHELGHLDIESVPSDVAEHNLNNEPLDIIVSRVEEDSTESNNLYPTLREAAMMRTVGLFRNSQASDIPSRIWQSCLIL
jgi:hypothetical protein